MPTVLSTKKLKPNQKSLLLDAGIGFVEQDFISIVPLEFDFNPEKLTKNIIFTSKNAVRVVLQQKGADFLKLKKIFCVGEKTAAFLEEKGLKATDFADYGAELAEKIAENHQNEEFLFFCGRKRRPELPEFFKLKKIPLTEVEVYDTIATPKKINRNFDGMLFFSPSAVESFCEENDLAESTAFCIGDTTASEAKKHTDNIIVANKPSIENVIVQVVKHFSRHKTQEND